MSGVCPRLTGKIGCLSSDGEKIAFVPKAGGIGIMNPDGSDVAILAGNFGSYVPTGGLPMLSFFLVASLLLIPLPDHPSYL